MKRIPITPRRFLLASALFAAVLYLAVPAAGFKVEPKGTGGLDGKVVVSPAAERITTERPDGGDQVGPGSTIERAVIVQNRTEDPIEFDLDVAQVVGADAELIVEVRHGVREGAAAWVTLERSNFRLKPGDQATVGLTIAIPDKIKPGSKPFAVSVTQRSSTTQAQGAGIAPQFKQDAIFIIEIPGDAPVKAKLTKAEITSASLSLDATRDGEDPPVNNRWYVGPKWNDTSPHRLTLTTLYENDGEKLLTPTGKVVVRDIFGRIAGSWDIEQFTVYPGGEAAGTVELKGLPSLGIFQTKVTLESEGGTQETTLPRFVQVPYWFIFAVGAFLLYVAYQVLMWRLRRRREWQRYLDEAGADGAVAGDYDADSDDGSDDARYDGVGA